MKTVFRNCTMLLAGRKVERGDIVFDGGTGLIDEIAPGGGVPAGGGARALDMTGRLVMPGFVNCHCHAPMALLRGVGGGLPLQRWLAEAIFPVEARMTDEDIHAGAVWGAMEMLAGGTTTVADMYDGHYQQAFLETGMRARTCVPGRVNAPGKLEECISRTREWNRRMERDIKADVYMDICVHSEYLTDEKFCRDLAAANRELGRRLHVHVSETRREHEECIARHGMTPIAYLASTGLFDRGGYAAHCVWCTDDDFRIMAERDISLVHNPTSNMKLGSGFARVARAMELGVNVALGTDGTASNDNLDMFEEMHIASLIHKGVALDPTVLSPWDVIEMATANGAKALGRGDIGEIAPGRCADFCVVDMARLHLQPAWDIPALAVYSMHSGDVASTWVGGREIYRRDAPPAQFDGASRSAGEAREALVAAARRVMPGAKLWFAGEEGARP